MDELIKITTNDTGQQLTSGRELFEFLEVKERYSKWFDRMIGYGFVEGIDYTPYQKVHPMNDQEITDHVLTIDMAKEISMIQRTEKGKQARRYFIAVEKEYKQQPRIPSTPRELARLALSANEETNERVDLIENEIEDIKNNQLLTEPDYRTISTMVRNKIRIICTQQHLNSKAKTELFKDLNSSIKRITGAAARNRIKAKQFEEVVKFINNWMPSTATMTIIDQMDLLEDGQEDR